MNEHVTLMPPDARGPAGRGISSGFPADLLSQSAARLRVLALLYAFVFFMAGILPALLFPGDRARFLGSFVQWGPGVIGIVVALLVAAVIRSARVPLPTAMNIGLAFEIASSYAIAAAEFADPTGLEMHRGWLGLSWVAVWVVLFTVVVPTSPRRAVLAALASVSSVPVIIGLMIASEHHLIAAGPGQVLLGARVSLPPRGGHGLCGGPRGLPAGHRGQARAGAGELPPGGEARRGGDGGGLASPTSHAGEARRHQAHPALLRRGRACRSVGRSSPPIRARSPGDRPPPLAPYRGALRFRRCGRRRLLLRHGAARRPRCRLAAPALRANPARAGHLPASPGLSLAVGGPVMRPGSSRHQTREHLPLPVRRGVRLREGAGFRHRARCPRLRGHEPAAHPGERGPWYAGVHGPRAGDGHRCGRARRHLCDRLCGLLAPHGAIRVHRRDPPWGFSFSTPRRQPTPPSARTDSPIPAALDDLVLSCLAKDPANRPQSARELSLRLAEVGGASAWTQDRAREWWATHQLALV